MFRDVVSVTGSELEPFANSLSHHAKALIMMTKSTIHPSLALNISPEQSYEFDVDISMRNDS